MQVCTIIARNYLAHARVLAESFLEHHPGGRFTLLVLDDPEGEIAGAGHPFDVLSPYEIGIARDEVHRMAMIYDVMELATAVKPWLLSTLLDGGAADVTYFDPDIEVLAPLDDISEAARRHSIVLIPHTLEPLPRDGREPSETTILYSGVYNLGFIAVGAGARPFLDWWCERLARECILEPDEHRFVDQRWVDFVPGLFDHLILRDPGCDVAHWNVHSRSFEWTGERYEVDAVPLRFYHFSGFDPERPEILSKHQGQTPRVLLSERPALAQLCREYARKVLAAGYRDVTTLAYFFDRLPGGLPVDRRMRRLYRSTLLAAERRGEALPPDPFDPEETEDFLAWLRAPADSQGGAASVSRYLGALYDERPDLRTAFPDLRWRDADPYLEWVLANGRDEAEIPDALLPERPGAARDDAAERSALLSGLNVSGFLRAELGIGEAARQVVGAVELTGIPFATVAYTGITSSRQDHPFEATPDEPVFDTNVICVNADILPEFAYDVGPDFFRGRYSIGVWWWEVSVFPSSMHRAFDFVDEVWVGSDYAAEALSVETDKPVHVMPLPVRLPEREPLTRRELGLPEDRFLFLFSFDYLSVFERKNPLALVEAFTRAFAPDEGPVLVIKSINGDKCAMELERLRDAAADRPDIVILDKYVSAHEKNSYMAVCDCYVSLHRSEGFGLTMAEAMAYGKPVIGTGYSGNLGFMTEENSFLVPFKLTSVPRGCEPYPAGAEWAEPDVDEAAALLRRVHASPAEAAERGQRAREDIATHRSPQRAADFVTRRFEAIKRERIVRPPSSVAAEQAALAAGPGSVQRLAAEVARGPVALRTSHSRRGAPVALLRRVLQRLLWPYVKAQHEANTALLASLTTSETVQRQQAQRLASLEAAMRASARERARVLERSEDVAAAEARLADVSERLRVLERHVGQVTSDAATSLAAVEAHLAELTEGVAVLRTERDVAAAPDPPPAPVRRRSANGRGPASGLPEAEEIETDVGALLLPARDEVMRPLIARTGDWERDEAALFAAELRPGMTVIDVGAHVGYYTLLAARRVGDGGRVIAVEPDPANSALLRENVSRNAVGNVEVIEAAAWRESSRLALSTNAVNSGDSRVGELDGSAEGIEVEAVSLDELVGPDTAVHAVKIDAQGADHVAVQGMQELLKRCRPVVFVEFWPEAIRALGDDPDDVVDFYRSLGFRLTMPGAQASFDEWTPQRFVAAAESLPDGFGTIVLRARPTS